MGQLIKIRKDYKLRIKKDSLKMTQLVLRTLRNNKKLFNYKTYKFFLAQFDQINLTRPKNLCFITGNGRGVVQKYRMVRHQFKELANGGCISGFRKATF